MSKNLQTFQKKRSSSPLSSSIQKPIREYPSKPKAQLSDAFDLDTDFIELPKLTNSVSSSGKTHLELQLSSVHASPIFDNIADYDSDSASTANIYPSISESVFPCDVEESLKIASPTKTPTIMPPLEKYQYRLPPSFPQSSGKRPPDLFLVSDSEIDLPLQTSTSKTVSRVLSPLSPTSDVAKELKSMRLENPLSPVYKAGLQQRRHRSLNESDSGQAIAEPNSGLLGPKEKWITGQRSLSDSAQESYSSLDWKDIEAVESVSVVGEAEEKYLRPIITDCIKEELKCKIQLARLKAGKDELQVDFSERKEEIKLSMDEIRQKNDVRERNRIHAHTSRLRFKQQMKEEEMKYFDLLESNKRLEMKKDSLKRHLQTLKSAIQEHENSHGCKLKK